MCEFCLTFYIFGFSRVRKKFNCRRGYASAKQLFRFLGPRFQDPSSQVPKIKSSDETPRFDYRRG